MNPKNSELDRKLVNNDYYHDLKDRWYEANDDAISLLRAESKIKNAWVQSVLMEKGLQSCEILDVGCGAGFLSNFLSVQGHKVSGLDMSESSLQTAIKYDSTQQVQYVAGDAYELPFADQSFDVVTCMDFLEHVSQPQIVLKEIKRVLRPEGILFFHTFNKTWLSYIMAVKGVEWVVKKSAPAIHNYDLFIRPKELKSWLSDLNFKTEMIKGIKPQLLSKAFLHLILTRQVRPDFEFVWTDNLQVGYVGHAILKGPAN